MLVKVMGLHRKKTRMRDDVAKTALKAKVASMRCLILELNGQFTVSFG